MLLGDSSKPEIGNKEKLVNEKAEVRQDKEKGTSCVSSLNDTPNKQGRVI